jgi:hypothetical protein
MFVGMFLIMLALAVEECCVKAGKEPLWLISMRFLASTAQSLLKNGDRAYLKRRRHR